MKKPVIVIKNLVNKFGSQVVHDRVNLTVQPGEVLGIVGGSGSGKTVLLRSILGIQPFAGGSISLLDHNIKTLEGQERRHLLQKIGFLFQKGALFSSLNVLENIKAPLKEQANVPEPYVTQIAIQKMIMAGLTIEEADKLPSQLSGGMIKRVALARALALDPDILFLDEPTSGLDPISARRFDDLIKKLKEILNLTVVMVTHDLESLYRICDRVAVLLHKKLTVGSLEEVVQIKDPWIQEYFSQLDDRLNKEKKKV